MHLLFRPLGAAVSETKRFVCGSIKKLKRGEPLPESEGTGGSVKYQSLDQPVGEDFKDPFGDEL